MPITFPVPEGARFAFYRISTGALEKRYRKWPVSTGGPLPDPDPDYVPLIEVDGDRPIHDENYFRPVAGAPVVDLAAETVTTPYTIVERTAVEVKALIDQHEKDAAATFVPFAGEEMETRLMVGVLLRDQYTAWTPPQAVLDRITVYVQNTIRMWQNRVLANEYKANLDAGLKPDYTVGWQKDVV